VFRILLVICCFFLCILSVQGQNVLNGHVLENKSRITLHGVRIKNLNNDALAISGDHGEFSIAAKIGDLIVFRAFSYQPDTVLVTNMHEQEIFLLPQTTELNQVNITDTGNKSATVNKNSFHYYDPQFHGQTIVYHRNKLGEYDGGIIVRMHYFKKDEHDKKKALQKVQDRAISQEISTIFTADNISHYLPLKGVDLDDFLTLYTPNIKLYNTKEFNLLDYLNNSYKTWLTLTPDQRKANQIFKKP
jgi:hypothetical protein